MKSNKNKRSSSFNPDPETNPHLPDPVQQKRIEHLRQEIRRISGDQAVFGSVQDCPPDVLHGFLEQVLDFETAPQTTARDLLAEEGIDVPAPDTLNDAQLHEQLWKVIHGLAKLRTYLEQTDHVSDRELYTRLWEDLLHQDTTDIRDDADSAYHLDLLGGCSEQDVLLSMRHYAGEDERARWLESFPDYEMPPHEDPAYDRDRLLPRPNRPCDRAPTGNN